MSNGALLNKAIDSVNKAINANIKAAQLENITISKINSFDVNINDLDKKEENYIYDKDLFIIYQNINQLLYQAKDKFNPVKKIKTKDLTAKLNELYIDVFHKLATFFEKKPDYFKEHIKKTKVNDIFIYLYFIDVIQLKVFLHHKELKALRTVIIDNQSPVLKEALIFLSPNIDLYTEFSKLTTQLNLTSEQSNQTDRLKIINGSLDCFKVDLHQLPIYIKTLLQYKLASDSFYQIEKHVVTLEQKQELSLKTIITLGFDIKEKPSPTQHIKSYAILSSNLRVKVNSYTVLPDCSNYYMNLTLDLAERHLSEAKEYITTETFHIDEILALTYNIERLLISIKKTEKWPLNKIKESDYWKLCAKVFLNPFLHNKKYFIQLAKLIKPITLGLFQFNQLKQAFQLSEQVITTGKYFPKISSEIIGDYNIVFNLILKISKHIDLTHFDSESIKKNISYESDYLVNRTFIKCIINSIFHIISANLLENNHKLINSLLIDIEDFFIKDSSRKGFKRTTYRIKTFFKLFLTIKRW